MDLAQLLAQFNMTQFLGLAGAPTIRQFVEYLRVQWKLPTVFAPVASIISGIGLNAFLMWALAVPIDLRGTVALGVLVGLAASVWHEIAKKQ